MIGILDKFLSFNLHFNLIIGDFNFPDICWPNTAYSTQSKLFLIVKKTFSLNISPLLRCQCLVVGTFVVSVSSPGPALLMIRFLGRRCRCPGFWAGTVDASVSGPAVSIPQFLGRQCRCLGSDLTDGPSHVIISAGDRIRLSSVMLK